MNSRLLTSAWSPCRVQGDLSLAQSSAHEPSRPEQPRPGRGVCRSSSICRRIHHPRAQLLLRQNLCEHHLFWQGTLADTRASCGHLIGEQHMVLDSLSVARCRDITAKIVKHVESKDV